MKQPKKLTRNQKILLSKKGINAKGLMVVAEDRQKLTLIDPKTKRITEVLL